MESHKRVLRSAIKSHQNQNKFHEASPSLSIKRRRTLPTKFEPLYEEQFEELQNLAKQCKTEKKKRRSSFVRGRSRKSIGIANADVTEIHTKIPTDKPPEERLRLLKLACLEYTMTKLHEEFPILETMENVRKNGTEEFEKSLQELVEDGTLHAACQSTSLNENPVNLEMGMHISQIDETIQRLTDESKQWDEMLTSFTQKTEEAAARSETESLPLKEPETMSIAQRKLLAELPDLADVISSAGKSQEKITIQVDELTKSFKQIEQFQGSVNSFLSQEIKRLAKQSAQGFTDIDDPRTLLERCGK